MDKAIHAIAARLCEDLRAEASLRGVTRVILYLPKSQDFQQEMTRRRELLARVARKVSK